MKRINHLLPLKIRYGFAALGALIIIGKVVTYQEIFDHHLLSSLFQAYYLLSLGVLFLLVGLLASEQALENVFGDDKHRRAISGDSSPGMGVKKNSIFGEHGNTHSDGGGGGD